MPKIIDISNQIFGKLTAIKKVSTKGKSKWLCLCECGNKKVILQSNLIRGKSTTCGNIKCKNNKPYLDLLGKTFEKLQVTDGPIRKREASGNISVFWECKCECGNTTIVRGSFIKSGRTKSCGCLKVDLPKKINKTHGLSKHPLYIIYCSMKQRCYSKNRQKYKYWGGKGINICEEWLNDFQAFYDWAVNNGWKEGLEIDRIDVNGNYEPSNCHFVNDRENAINRSNKSKYGTGVTKHKNRNKPYQAHIYFNSTRFSLGYFYTKKEAQEAYWTAKNRIESGKHPKTGEKNNE